MQRHDEQVIAEALDVLQCAEETVRAEQWFRQHDGTWKPAHNPLGWKGVTVHEHWVITR